MAAWLRLGVSVALVSLGYAGCSAASATIRCVFENGSTTPGRCLTECESRCNLETKAGCAPPACVAQCTAATAQRPRACVDADYTHWRCLRTAGAPIVTCEDGVPVLEVPAGLCEPEQRAMDAACEGQNMSDRFDAGMDATADGSGADLDASAE